jgi:hypothetical protein
MGIKKLLHNEGKTILYQNQAQPHHNTTYSKQKVGLSSNSMLVHQELCPFKQQYT